MARVAFNKSSLTRQRAQLKIYQQFLPSLDMKRRQLIAEHLKARAQVKATDDEIAAQLQDAGRRVPMLASRNIAIDGLLKVREVRLKEQNLLGTVLPVLEEVVFVETSYSFLAKPHWVDVAFDLLQDMVRLRVRRTVEAERVDRLAYAVHRVTQRVNLFEKVLLPETQKTIKRIQIFLGDLERAGVVQAKIAKAKRQKALQREKDQAGGLRP